LFGLNRRHHSAAILFLPTAEFAFDAIRMFFVGFKCLVALDCSEKGTLLHFFVYLPLALFVDKLFSSELFHGLTVDLLGNDLHLGLGHFIVT